MSKKTNLTVTSVIVRDSIIVTRIAYDNRKRNLTVQLTGGRTYQYAKVAAKVAKEFMTAPSKGRFYNEHIRGNYESQEAV